MTEKIKVALDLLAFSKMPQRLSVWSNISLLWKEMVSV